MATPQRKVTPFPAKPEPKRKRKRATPWSELIARTGISRHTPLFDMPQMLQPVEAAAWLGLGRDAAYQLASKRVGRRVFVQRALLEELALKK